MKLKNLILLGLLTLLGYPDLSAQTPTGNCNQQVSRACKDTQTITTSGSTITIPNNGGLTPSFEEIINGVPSTISITISGCGTSATCDVLDTYTTVTNAIRAPTVSKLYSYYTVNASWTGGSSVSIIVNTQITSARVAGSGGGGSGTASNTPPLMDGTAAAGSNITYSRADHIHPTDTSRVSTSTTVNGHALSSNISITQSDVGLGNVNNTSDTAKPVSTAQSTAINAAINTAISTVTTINGASFPAASTANTVPVVTAPNTISYTTVPNLALAHSTISGISLGGNLNTLTFGTHLITGDSSYNGSTATTITSDATNTNTASTVVARDASGNFSAGTITAVLTGMASNAGAVNGNTFPSASSFISGGIPYFSSTNVEASSALLTHYGLVYGGGSGGAPVSMVACAANFPVVGSATSPACSTIGWLPSATAYGLPYMSTATQMATTGALTKYGVLLGGGSTSAPTATAASTIATQALFATSTSPAFRYIAYPDLPALPANTILGALSATTPSGLLMPTCDDSSSALIWTPDTGFGCNTISGGEASGAASITSGTIDGAVIGDSVPELGIFTTVQSQQGFKTTGNGGTVLTTTSVPIAFLPGNTSCTVTTTTLYHMPTCTPAIGMLVPIADSDVATGCDTTVGGGSTFAWAFYNGSAWAPTNPLCTATSLNGTSIPASATLPIKVFSGSQALGTSAIASGAYATTITVTATGVLSTDTVTITWASDPTAVTGYAGTTSGALTIYVFPAAGTITIKVYNGTSASVTPGAMTLNLGVTR